MLMYLSVSLNFRTTSVSYRLTLWQSRRFPSQRRIYLVLSYNTSQQLQEKHLTKL